MGISSEARSPRSRWLLCALLALAWTNGGVHAQPQTGTPAPSLEGIWVFDGGPSFPGPRYLRITTATGPAKGALITDWYGDLPMNKLHIEGDVAHFEIDNGNPRLPPKPWTATLAGGNLRVVGDIWSTHVDIKGRRGSEADAQRLAFKPASPSTSTTRPSAASPTRWCHPACAMRAMSTSISTTAGRAGAMPMACCSPIRASPT